ncbi:MAG TPA: dihydrolipoamide acetyltransferase family protein [Gaiellaceae bacterium]|nr:dihydrolipoamide acetyltransferase family protein [Gaiellaceae bacterium]
MPSDVIMPALGMAQETGKVLRWLKAEGDAVEKGEPLLEIETDKVTVEIEAPATGVLAGVRAAEGDDVPVGETIAFLLAAGESLAAVAPAPTTLDVREAPAPAEPVGRRRALASPKARRLAAERGVDLDALAGSGPGGAVLAADVTAPPDRAGGAAVSGIWRVMAERTTESWRTVPHFYLRREVDASRLENWRAVTRAKPGQERTSHTDLLVKLVAEALRRHPRVNSTWRDGTIVPGERINVGIAVAVEEGLVVPVVHDVDRLSVADTVVRRIELVDAARAGRLTPQDVSGGTFTVSNLSMFGVDSFDAIVNAPQAAILAVGRIADRVVAVSGRPEVRPTLNLSVSFDHRVVDGARGAEFLETLASLIEEPAGLVG